MNTLDIPCSGKSIFEDNPDGITKIKLLAADPDVALNGEIQYEIRDASFRGKELNMDIIKQSANGHQILNFLKINPKTGEISFNNKYSNEAELVCNYNYEFKVKVRAFNPNFKPPLTESFSETDFTLRFISPPQTQKPDQNNYLDDPNGINQRPHKYKPAQNGQSNLGIENNHAQDNSQPNPDVLAKNMDILSGEGFIWILLIVALIMFAIAVTLLTMVLVKLYKRYHKNPDNGRGKYYSAPASPEGKMSVDSPII